MTPPKELIEILEKKDNFLILTHSTPDGDAFGSALALKFSLNLLSKRAEVYTEMPIPAQYKFLPGINEIKDLVELSPDKFDVLILVDCHEPTRVNNNDELISKITKFSGIKVIIDHHVERKKSDFHAVKWISPHAAATGMMVYELIKKLNIPINASIATLIYSALIVDTGNFQFDNTTDKELYIASELVKAGAKPSFIYQNLFEGWTTNRLKLFIKMLDKTEIIPPFIIGHLRKKDFEETNTIEADTERFVEFLRILKDVSISVLFREIEEGFFKVSLRSKGNLDVSIIAQSFGGGGHKNAAGYRIRANYEAARDKLIESLKNNKML